MKIKRYIGGNLESNGFVIYDKEQGEGYIIDPGYNAEVFIKASQQLKLTIKGILLTHHHYDHTGAVNKVAQALECPIYMHRADADQYRDQVDVMLEGGETLMLGEEAIQVIHTPGHTKGGLCFYSAKSKLAFTGDTVFNVDLGRTDLGGGSDRDMIHSCKNIIDKWGNDITIYPGHGDPATMKYVREVNEEFLACLKA